MSSPRRHDDRALWMHECKALRATSFLGIEMDRCPHCGTLKRLRVGKVNGQAADPHRNSSRTESHERSSQAEHRRPHGKNAFPLSDEHKRKIGAGKADTERRKRVAAALPDIRRACWSELEDGDGSVCDLCGATVPADADQQTRDAAHRPECLVAAARKD